MSARRRGRKESRPGQGGLLPRASQYDLALRIKRLGANADITLIDQLSIDYVRLAAFKPCPPVVEWNKKPDPTPEEIKQRCAEIRETWDRNRWKLEDMRKHVEITTYSTGDLGL